MKHAATAEVEEVAREVTEDCLVTRARRISRVLTAIYDQELRPYGINSPQFTLLVVMHRLQLATRAEIGRQNNQDRSTMTRNLQLILDAGWAEEVPHAAAGRSRPVALTQAGKDLLLRASPGWKAAQAQTEKILGERGVGAIRKIVHELPAFDG
jgi:DNA-binding MarR family transcriptional regulator